MRDFARNEVAPVAEELDRTKAFPYEIVRKLGELTSLASRSRGTAGAAGIRWPMRWPSRS